jgi:hypothetical protein
MAIDGSAWRLPTNTNIDDGNVARDPPSCVDSVSMKHRSVIATFLGVLLSASGLAAEEKTITGWVLDSACAITKGLKKPISSECAVACAKKGSPLAILLDNGALYWPIADTIPADGQNERLLPFAGKRVTATGKVYKQGGSNSIVIEKIAEAGGK